MYKLVCYTPETNIALYPIQQLYFNFFLKDIILTSGYYLSTLYK